MSYPVRSVILQLGLISALVAPSLAAQRPDPIVGNWRLDVKRSTFSSPIKLKSETIKVEALDDGAVRVVTVAVTDGLWGFFGKQYRSEFVAKYDGLDYPISGLPQMDTVALTRINNDTVERIGKKAGKVVEKVTRRITSDLATMHVVHEVLMPDGTWRSSKLTFVRS